MIPFREQATSSHGIDPHEAFTAALEAAELEFEDGLSSAATTTAAPRILDPPGVREFRWKLPRRRFVSLYSYLGKPSSVSSPEDDRGAPAVAIWEGRHNKTLISYRIELRDRPKLHWPPDAHLDFLKLTINQPIQAARIFDVTSISDSIGYEASTTSLSATCHFLGATVATLSLALAVAGGKISSTHARMQYGARIKSTLHPSYGKKAYIMFLTDIGLPHEGPFPAPGALYDEVLGGI